MEKKVLLELIKKRMEAQDWEKVKGIWTTVSRTFAVKWKININWYLEVELKTAMGIYFLTEEIKKSNFIC